MCALRSGNTTCPRRGSARAGLNMTACPGWGFGLRRQIRWYEQEFKRGGSGSVPQRCEGQAGENAIDGNQHGAFDYRLGREHPDRTGPGELQSSMPAARACVSVMVMGVMPSAAIWPAGLATIVAASGHRPRRCLSVISQMLATLTNTCLPGAAIAALALRPNRSELPSHQANVWVSSSSAVSASAARLWSEILGALTIPKA